MTRKKDTPAAPIEGPAEAPETDTPANAQASELDALAAAIEGGQPLPAGPVPEPKPEPEPELPTGALVGLLLGVTFDMLAGRLGDHWRLSPQEQGAMGDAWGAVVDHYYPDLKVGPLGVAVMITVPVVGGRYVVTLQERAAAAQAAADAEGEGDAGTD